MKTNFWYKLIYIGNGATKRTDSDEGGTGSGALRYCITKRFFRKEILIEKLFEQKEAVFTGYYIRKKHKKTWLWYCTDKSWKNVESIVESDGVSQELILPETKIKFSELGIRRGETVYLVAQWKHEQSGESMNCGYWVFRNPLMCHALGKAPNGKTYQNTRAVFERSYEMGYRYFEVDVALTEDEKLVCCHGWSENNCKVCGMEYKPEFEHMTYELFMKQTVNGNPTMDIRELCEIMRKYPDTYFEIDLHREQYEKKIECLIEGLEYDEALFDRLLIQAQGRPIFHKINGVHHFLNNQVIAGESWLSHMDGMISFALQHGLCAIALRKDLAQEKQVAMIRQAGIYVLAYTIKDDVTLSKKLLDRGVSTICTDGVTPEDIS